MTHEKPSDPEAEAALIEVQRILSGGRRDTLPEPNQLTTFSPEALRTLESEGTWKFGILSGQTIKDLRALGFHFWTNWHKDTLKLEKTPALKTQIAVNFQSFLIPGTANRSHEEQLRIIAELERKIQERIPDVAFMSPGFAESAVMLATGIINFDRDPRPRTFRTACTIGSDSIAFLMSDPNMGMHINKVHRDARFSDVYMGAIVAPRQ